MEENLGCTCDLRDRTWNPCTGRCETCGNKFRDMRLGLRNVVKNNRPIIPSADPKVERVCDGHSASECTKECYIMALEAALEKERERHRQLTEYCTEQTNHIELRQELNDVRNRLRSERVDQQSLWDNRLHRRDARIRELEQQMLKGTCAFDDEGRTTCIAVQKVETFFNSRIGALVAERNEEVARAWSGKGLVQEMADRGALSMLKEIKTLRTQLGAAKKALRAYCDPEDLDDTIAEIESLDGPGGVDDDPKAEAEATAGVPVCEPKREGLPASVSNDPDGTANAAPSGPTKPNQLEDRICIKCGTGGATERDYVGNYIHEGCQEILRREEANDKGGS